METVHTFISSGDIAIIICPNCNKSRNVSIAKYRDKKHSIKVRCECRHGFIVQLDFRRHYRKETNLEGIYQMVPPAFGSGRLYILNISKSGVGFTIGMKLSGKNSILAGQQMNIRFHLDNKKASEIEKIITVKSVNENYIGGQFIETKAFEKDLGFYLRE